MSLKHDIAEYPEMWSKEIVAALEDYKNGKRNSKRKLRKFVNFVEQIIVVIIVLWKKVVEMR